MLDSLLSTIAPYSCLACERRGPIVCHNCVAELRESRDDVCIGCGLTAGASGMCATCDGYLSFDAARVFDQRGGTLETLINRYKFDRVRSAYKPLAAMLASLLPTGPSYVLVPVPTVRSHVRQRGYDHASLLTKYVARLNGNTYAPLIRRRSRTVQHGTDRATRVVQADKAFYVAGTVDSSRTYIVCDDITTTGASLAACTRVLRAAGARTIIVAAVARQPLDDGR